MCFAFYCSVVVCAGEFMSETYAWGFKSLINPIISQWKLDFDLGLVFVFDVYFFID